MNKTLTTYLISAALGFASTLAVAQMAKADAPKFWYRHNASIGKQAETSKFTVTAQTPLTSRSLQEYIVPDPSDSNYYLMPVMDEYTLNSLFVFNASSSDIEQLNYTYVERSPNNSRTLDLTLKCENMKCIIDRTYYVSKFQLVYSDSEILTELTENMAQTISFTIKPTSVVLKDGTTQKIDVPAVTANHDFTVTPETMMQKSKEGDWKIWWKGHYVFFDDNGKMHGPTVVNYTAEEIRILEKVHAKIVSK